MRLRKILVLLIFFVVLLSGCGEIARYQVTCYQDGVIIYNGIVVLERGNLRTFYKDSEIGLEVHIYLKDCVWRQIK